MAYRLLGGERRGSAFGVLWRVGSLSELFTFGREQLFQNNSSFVRRGSVETFQQETFPKNNRLKRRQGAIARNLAYQAIFAPNLATPGAIDLLLPDGQRLQGHLLGLAYTEGNQSVLVAEVKDCAAQIGGPEQNEITFADAFTDFDISVKFILARDRVSQNVIVHQQLPHPREWNLTEDAVVEVLTEFTTKMAPGRVTR
jgi:hypothetical protein